LAEAIPLYETNLASKRRVLGDDHPDTINGCDNLGYAYHAAGRAADAVPLLEEVLRWRDRVLGSDDPQTAMSRAKLTQVRDHSAQPPAR
jgi:hypothetical protein